MFSPWRQALANHVVAVNPTLNVTILVLAMFAFLCKTVRKKKNNNAMLNEVLITAGSVEDLVGCV